MSNKLRELFPKGGNFNDFEEAFRKEQQICYAEASLSNEAGDDRQMIVKISQAEVWGRLLKLVSGK